MGYYVSIDYCSSPNDVFIKKENFAEAYSNLCWLNTNPEFDIMKSGGSYSGEGDARHKRPDGLDYHPNKWFSWMPADYHKTYKTLQEILNAVGFHITEEPNVGIVSLDYSDKTGNEDIFLCALAPFIESGSEITWVGEDNERWKHTFKNGKMYFHRSKILYTKEGSWVSLEGHRKQATDQDKFFAEMSAKMQQQSSK